MVATILLVLLWLLVIVHTTGGFMTLCRVMRYKDVFVNLDADRIAHQPFQPKISVVVRCDPKHTDDAVGRIQRLLSLNYTRYEVILIADSARQPECFAAILDFFELEPVPLPEETARLEFPVAVLYRSPQRLYGRLTVVDKPFHDADDLRLTGASVAKADYVLFVRSLDNDLLHNSLARLAILNMRHPSEHIAPIRGAARYDCGKGFRGNVFRLLTDLCNLRRIYIMGAIPKNDFGQFLTLEDVSGRRGREEFVPRPQMYLHRPNRLTTYLEQLAPRLRYKTWRGKLISFMELLFGLLFWGVGLHTVTTPGISHTEVVLLLAVLLMPLLSATFSVFVGEVLLKQNPRIGLILRLLLLSFLEAVLFCLLMPWAWTINRFVVLWRCRSTAG